MLAGRFSRGGKLPSVPANVTLHKGWIEDTLPPFAASTPGFDSRAASDEHDAVLMQPAARRIDE